MKKILFSILAIAALIGCGKDDNNTDAPAYSAEEAKTEVKATMDNFYECLKKANDGGFANFFITLLPKHRGKTNLGLVNWQTSLNTNIRGYLQR